VEKQVGNNLRFQRVWESNEIARSLTAVAGKFDLPSFYVEWDPEGSLDEYDIKNLGPLGLEFAAATPEDSLNVASHDGTRCVVEWKGARKQSFQLHGFNPVVIPPTPRHIYIDFDIYGLPNVRVVLEPVLGANNTVTLTKTAESVVDYSTDLSEYYAMGTERLHEGFHEGFVESLMQPVNQFSLFENLELPEISVLAISNLLFPERNALQLSEARLPGDLLMVGQIDPKETTFTLDPLLPVIKAGDEQQFTIRQLGLRNAVITWSVRAIDDTQTPGTIDDGYYTAPSAASLAGVPAVRDVVTATYVDEGTGQEVTASALVTVVHDSLMVTPSMAMIDMLASEGVSANREVKLKASTLSGSKLAWTMRGSLGTLVPNGNEAVYTPPATPPAKTLEAVQIEVRDTVTDEIVVASVLLSSGTFSLPIVPAFHPGLRTGAKTLLQAQFQEEELSLREELPLNWDVIVGDGSVTEGLYTAPQTATLPYEVVKASFQGAVSGYSIIHVSEYAPQSSWYSLGIFEFEVTTMPPTVYANGLQQAKVVVRVKPTDVDGEERQLSDSEYESIRLVSADQRLPLEEVGEGGVPKDGRWHFNVAENEYEKYPQQNPAVKERTNAVQVKEFFVQCHKVENLRVAALLYNDNLRPFYSNDEPGDGEENRKVINLIAVQPPEGGTEGGVSFTLSEPTRVEGGGDDEDMSTLDYYHLKLLINGVQVAIKDIEFTSNASMVRWETNTTLEDIHSITGYAIRNDLNEDGDTILHIDEKIMRRIAQQTQLPAETVSPTHPVPAGEVLFSLQRREYWRYDQYIKAEFDAAIQAMVFDKFGNKHSVNIGFDGTNRNQLKIIGQ
jgi:hypothetical protein